MIELAGMIRDLRDELERAVVEGEGSALRFELGPVELEVELAVERSSGGDGRVRFWVLELDAQRSRGTAETHRIKLVLNPKLGEQGHAVLITGSPIDAEW